MSAEDLKRTQYWNLDTNTPRANPTQRAETSTDWRSYLLPMSRMVGASLHTWGVAEGLTVSAMANQTDLTIAPGVGLDAAGHVIALASTGFAITDPNVDSNQMRNVPTVQVEARGVSLRTSPLQGDYFVTIRWREVEEGEETPILKQTPWLRLESVAEDQDPGAQLILAQVTLDSNSRVTALTPTGRRLVGVPVERVEFSRPQMNTMELSIDQIASAEVRSRMDGGVELNLLPAGGGQNRQLLAIDGATGNLWLAPQTGNVGIGTASPSAGLEIDKGATNDLALRLTSSGPGWGSGMQFRNTAQGGKAYGIYSGSGSLHFSDEDNHIDRLIIDSAGHVGIGTTTPENSEGWDRVIDCFGTGTAKLSIRTNTIDARVLAHENGWWGSKPGMVMGTKGTYALSLATNGATRLTVDPTGNVGIGATTPSAKLEVVGGAAINDGTGYAAKTGSMANGSLTIGSLQRSYGGGSSWNSNTAGLLLETQKNTEIAVHDSLHLIASLSYYEGDADNRLTIGRDMGWGSIGSIILHGNVGIGTMTPRAKLEVPGGGILNGLAIGIDPPPIGGVGDVSFPYPYETIGTIDSRHNLRLHSNGVIAFHTGNAQEPTGIIDRSGNLGIGTFSPQQKLHVKGAYIRVDGAGNEQAYIGGDGAGGDVQIGSFNGNIRHVSCWGANGWMDIHYRNNIGHSDKRDKTNITDIGGGLQYVTKLRGVFFDWKDQSLNEEGKKSVGFLAQEVQKILPEAVFRSNRGTYGINYSSLLPVVIEAIKEQQKEIEEIKVTIARRVEKSERSREHKK